MGSKHVDPRQQSMDLSAEVENYIQSTCTLLEHARAVVKPEGPSPGEDWKAELYIELAAGCKAAIEASGRSRAQIVDDINTLTGGNNEDGRKRLTLPMFNNYISKPTESHPPAWLVQAICKVTGDLSPYRAPVEAVGGLIIAAEDRAELLMGKLEINSKQLAALKRQLSKVVARKTGE